MPPERGEPLELLGDRDLEMVAGNRLVERQDFGLVTRPSRGFGRVDVVPARAAAVLGDGALGLPTLRGIVERWIASND